MSIDVARPAGVMCGIEYLLGIRYEECPEDLWRTYGPAGSLWCPVHGHVLDVFPSPPLTASVHLNYGGGKGEWVELEATP